jgi:iron-sulfur cluster assembly protein
MSTQHVITPDMTIDEIFEAHPQCAQKIAGVLSSAGLQCAGCAASSWETLEAGIYGHGLAEDDLKSILEQLNEVIQYKTDPSTISLSPEAAKKILSLQEKEKKAGYGLRFGDQAAGCSGYEYLLDFCKTPKADDEIFESRGISIFVDKKSLPRLLGCEIDYVDSIRGAGFKISNPNARTSCSCGSSHAY